VADRYFSLVNAGKTGKLAQRLGLPRPAELRRHSRGAPPATGPVLVIGEGPDAGLLTGRMREWGVDVRCHRRPEEEPAAVILVLTCLRRPEELGEAMLRAGSAMRRLMAGGRVIAVVRAASAADGPAQSAARQGAEVAVRSVARELRGGATANAVVPAGDVPVDAVGVVAAIRFLLSRRSAFMDGQVLHVDSVAGELPQDWELPLSGKTAVVTGAARGIGAETAAVLARDGARVAVVDVPRAGEELAATANRIGGTALQLDITAADAGQRILAHAGARLGQLDIVVHNAGITRDRLLVNMDATHWDQVMAVNIVAPLRVNEQLLGSDVFSSSGRIICLASISGIAGSRGQANYAASKAGVIGMVQATAKELRGGRTINAVAPGFIETDMTARMPLLVREAARRLSSLRQGGLPVDVAEAVAFLASDAAAGINGETVRVCGQSLVGA
jgi:3-oxoacyl-[acyl-carrier protein] reductase